MPHWMEAVVNDVPENELQELKIILRHAFSKTFLRVCNFQRTRKIIINSCYSKILDRDMNSLGFDVKKMYNFIAKRFVNTSAKVQEQALNWLQTLTMLEITLPLDQLFSIFSDGVAVMQLMSSAESELKPSKSTNEDDVNITCMQL